MSNFALSPTRDCRRCGNWSSDWQARKSQPAEWKACGCGSREQLWESSRRPKKKPANWLSSSPVEMDFSGKGPAAWRLNMKGSLPGGAISSIVLADIATTGPAQPYRFFLTCDRFDSTKQFHALVPIAFAGNQVRVEGISNSPWDEKWNSSVSISGLGMWGAYAPTSTTMASNAFKVDMQLVRQAQNWTAGISGKANDLKGNYGVDPDVAAPRAQR